MGLDVVLDVVLEPVCVRGQTLEAAREALVLLGPRARLAAPDLRLEGVLFLKSNRAGCFYNTDTMYATGLCHKS